MRSFITSVALWMAVTHQAMAFTYWIDDSCKGDRDMDAVIKEVKGFGESAHKRLNSKTDTDYEYVYELAMKRKKDANDQVFKSVDTFMQDVSKMTHESTRNAANVRVYCDDKESRWVERKDPETGRNLGGWEDKDNWIKYDTIIRPGCLFTRSGAQVSYAETFKTHMDGEPPEKQAAVRATISICDKSFFKNNQPIRGKTFSVYSPNANLAQDKFNIDSFGIHVSKIFLHELSHTSPYNTLDNKQAYCWNGNPYCTATVQDLSTKDLENHADVRAILGQMAHVADRGFTFHRKPRDDANDKEKKDYADATKKGQFQKYENITKKKREVQRRVGMVERRQVSAEAVEA